MERERERERERGGERVRERRGGGGGGGRGVLCVAEFQLLCAVHTIHLLCSLPGFTA